MLKTKNTAEKHFNFKKNCIFVIDSEIDLFFTIRLGYSQEISRFLLNGTLKNSKEIIKYLNISDNEIKELIETIVYKVCDEIKYSFSYEAASSNNIIDVYHNKDHENANINTLTKAQQVAIFCKMLSDKSFFKILTTYCNNLLKNCIINKTNSPENVLDKYTVDNQNLNDNSIFEKIEGYIMNMKFEIRNKVVGATVVFLNLLCISSNKTTVA